MPRVLGVRVVPGAEHAVVGEGGQRPRVDLVRLAVGDGVRLLGEAGAVHRAGGRPGGAAVGGAGAHQHVLAGAAVLVRCVDDDERPVRGLADARVDVARVDALVRVSRVRHHRDRLQLPATAAAEQAAQPLHHARRGLRGHDTDDSRASCVGVCGGEVAMEAGEPWGGHNCRCRAGIHAGTTRIPRAAMVAEVRGHLVL